MGWSLVCCGWGSGDSFPAPYNYRNYLLGAEVVNSGGSTGRGPNGWGSSYRVIAHIDMDAFFASVEVLDNPGLKGKPVIVGGASRRGVVSAASYEARRFGVHSAMPVFQARKVCPYGVFLPPRMNRYREISRIAMKCLRGFSPLVEQVSVDEAYIDLTGTDHIFGGPEKAVLLIKKRIIEETSLTCSIGVSTCKFLAKVASAMNKPDGVTIIPPGRVRQFLDTLPIGMIPGIGEKSEQQLLKIGIKNIGDVGKYSPDMIRDRFGRFGLRLLKLAEGKDGSPVVPYTPPKSISAEQTLEEDTGDKQVLKSYMLRQAERVGRTLRKRGFRGKTVTLKIKHSDFRQVTRRITLERPTQFAKVIFREAAGILDAYKLRSEVRLIGVGVSNLEPAGSQEQLTLFGESRANEEKWEKAERAMDEIVRRFGDKVLRRGTLPNR